MNHAIFPSTGGRRFKLAVVLGIGILVILTTLNGSTAAKLAAPGPTYRASQQRIDFNREIRQILSEHCFACHGPDAPNKRIKLRLDSEAAAKADLGDGRHAVVPGQPDLSEVVKRITAADESMRMPPVYSGHHLTPAQIALIVAWIKGGADWQTHWAFISPAKAPLPQVSHKSWPKNPIDYWVLKRLEDEGLEPSKEADQAALIRRVSLDLVGLPPTPKEVDEFLNDHSPNAYERVVDRFLASPAYGERMAFPWLDAARYADTNGYQIDGDRTMWRWRDWVIDSFNRNLPYDRFVIEQLAGDLLPNAGLDQQIATAFNRNHRINAEGGIVAEEYAVEYVVDRVDTTSTVFMGLTMGCARCHNHKFDPITQKEYYQLFAYFNSIPEDGRAYDQGNSAPWIAAPDRDQQRRLGEMEDEIAYTEAQLHALTKRVTPARLRWEKTLSASVDRQWFPSRNLLIHFPFDQASKPVFNKSDRPYHNPPEKLAENRPSQERIRRTEADNPTEDSIGYRDGAPKFVRSPTGQGTSFDGRLWFDAGRHADFKYKSISVDYKERFAISVWIYPESEQSGAIVTKMPDNADEKDHNLPRTNGWGLFFANGKINFQMVREWNYDGYRGETEENLPLRRWSHVLLAFDGLLQADERVQIYVNGVRQKLKVNQPTLYLYWGLPETPLRIGAGGGPEMRFKGAMGELRIYTAIPGPDQIAVLACADSLGRIAAIPKQKRTKAQSDKLLQAYLESEAPKDAQELWKKLNDLKEAKKKFDDGFPTLMVMQELSSPRPAYILKRGAYDAQMEKVERGVPAILPKMPSEYPSNRLGFAEWLVSPAHPLTPRVEVNRLWQMLFGTGLVKTAEDFGTQGEPPSHQELLDWLAVELRESGWNIKAMLKTMVMSATYRQASKVTPALQQRDPDNRLLARGPRFRLPAEMIRDQALSVSGLLVEKLGGPSVKPYQPEGMYKDMAFSGLTGYDRARDEGLWRRSLYTFWKRTVLSPNMQVFDASAREFCTVREARTNTPLQSLNLMNDVTYIEAARLLAQRMMLEGGTTPQARIQWAFRVATSRPPGDKETNVLLRNFEKQLYHFTHNPQDAANLLAVGEKRIDKKLNPAEAAAYAMTASLILNLDEVITKQ